MTTTETQRLHAARLAGERVRPSTEARGTSRGSLKRPMLALKAAHFSGRTVTARITDRVIRIGSSPPLFIAHAIWFAVWIVWNTGLLGVPAIDPYPFGLLTMIVSLEAIGLAILVLIGQSREAAVAELREELTFQIILRIEEEVTKNLQLAAGLYTRMGHRVSEDDELSEMLKALDPAEMEQELAAEITRITGRA